MYQTSKAYVNRIVFNIYFGQQLPCFFGLGKLLPQFFPFQLQHGPPCLVLIPRTTFSLGSQGFLYGVDVGLDTDDSIVRKGLTEIIKFLFQFLVILGSFSFHPPDLQDFKALTGFSAN